MGFYKVFTNQEQELSAYINTNNECFISIKSSNQDNYFDSGFIALSKEDLLSLIEYLTELSDELDDSNDKF